MSPVRHIPYDHPTGLIVYDRSGWMSVQIAIKGDRRPFTNGLGSGTQEEKAARLRQLLLLLRPLHNRSKSANHHPPHKGLFLSRRGRGQQCPLVRIPGQRSPPPDPLRRWKGRHNRPKPTRPINSYGNESKSDYPRPGSRHFDRPATRAEGRRKGVEKPASPLRSVPLSILYPRISIDPVHLPRPSAIL